MSDRRRGARLGALLRTVLAALLMVAGPAHAADLKVAVAANFTDPIRAIAPLFEQATGHKLVLSFGATGRFYAQITQGAPFDVLLAADKTTPAKAIAEGLAVEGTAFTYAVGRLVLYSKSAGLVTGEETLRHAGFARIAIANPDAAPYGAAAIEVMKRTGVLEALKPKLVYGQNIAQAYQFVATGNVEVGFVALSQVVHVGGGSRWLVPKSLHAPIEQDAVLLKAGSVHPGARAFLEFLRSAPARAEIERFGYGTNR